MSALKIAINTRLLIKNKMEGIGWYTKELVERMVLSHPEVEFYFFFDRTCDPSFIFADNVHPIVIGPPTRHVFLISYWFDVAVVKALKKIKADLFFSPDSINSLRPVCKTITTLHDVNFISHPENLSFLVRRFYNRRTPSLVKTSNAIVTVSEFSKNEIIRLLDVSEEKVSVIYNACRPGFAPINNELKESIRKKYTSGHQYFIYIGGFYRRKNLKKLVRSFELFKEKDITGIKLVLIGQVLKEGQDIIEQINASKCKGDIIITGRVDDDNEMQRMLASAMALTYVSELEGFGMPLVEAMSSGIPSIVSNSSSLPEIGGAAALYVDPQNEEDIAEKMHLVANDENLRNDLAIKAKEQAKKFNWDKSAEQLWDLILATIKSN